MGWLVSPSRVYLVTCTHADASVPLRGVDGFNSFLSLSDLKRTCQRPHKEYVETKGKPRPF